MDEPAKRSKILDAAIASVPALFVYADFDGARSESLIFEGQARVEDNATLVIWGQRIPTRRNNCPALGIRRGPRGHAIP